MLNAWCPWVDMGHFHSCWDFESYHLYHEEISSSPSLFARSRPHSIASFFVSKCFEALSAFGLFASQPPLFGLETICISFLIIVGVRLKHCGGLPIPLRSTLGVAYRALVTVHWVLWPVRCQPRSCRFADCIRCKEVWYRARCLQTPSERERQQGCLWNGNR